MIDADTWVKLAERLEDIQRRRVERDLKALNLIYDRWDQARMPEEESTTSTGA